MPNPFSPWRAVFGRRGKPKDDGPTGSPSRYPWDPQSTIRGNLAIGSLRESLLKTLATDRGVHVETLLAATGALTGYAALNAALARAAERGDVVPENALVLVSTRDGRRFFFGDWPNLHLFEERESEIPLFRAVGAAALTLGLPREKLPDPGEIAGHVARSVGDASFGVLRTSPEHQPHFPPTEIVVKLWPLVLEVMAAPLPGGLEEPLLSEAHWPVVLSIVANQYVAMTNATLDTEIGLRLLMEAAVIGAKLDPELVEPGKWSFEAAEGRLSVARRPG